MRSIRFRLSKPAQTLVTAIVTFTNLLAPLPVSASIVPERPRPQCRIEIDNAHISTSLLQKRGARAVKVNARSICNRYQSEVKLNVRIYKVGRFWNQKVMESTTNPYARTSSGFRITNNSTSRTCTSRRKTLYFGVASATALIDGQIFVAPSARSPQIIQLRCGT